MKLFAFLSRANSDENKPQCNKLCSFLQSDALVFVLVGIITATAIALTFQAQIDFLDDNCHYMNLGKALYTGKGYVQLHHPAKPHENTVAPGLPLILALLMSIRGNTHDIVFFNLFSSLCVWAYVLLFCVVLVRTFKVNRFVALSICTMLALNVRMLKYASIVSTEAPFMFCSMLVAYLVFRYEETGKKLFMWLVILATILTLYIKITALPIFIILFAWYFLRRKYIDSLRFAIFVTLAIGIWLVPTMLTTGWYYKHQFASYDVVREVGPSANPILAYSERFLHHITKYIFIYIPDHICPFLWESIFYENPRPLGYGVGAFLALLAIFGLIRGRKNVYALFFGAFLGGYIFIYSFLASCQQRYIDVFAALFAFILYYSLSQLLKMFKLRQLVENIVLAVVFIAIAAANFPSMAHYIRFTRETRKRYFSHENNETVARLLKFKYQLEVNVARYHDALKWCRQNLPKDAVLLTSQVRTAYFISELECLYPPYMFDNEADTVKYSPPERVKLVWTRALEHGVTHVVVDETYWTTVKYIRPGALRFANCLKLLFATAAPQTYVFEIDTVCLRRELEEDFLGKLNEQLITLADMIYNHRYVQREAYKRYIIHKIGAVRSEDVIRLVDYSYKVTSNFAYTESLMTAADDLLPHNAPLWLNYGISLNNRAKENLSGEMLQQKTNAAIAAFDRALTYGADSSDVFNNIGVTLSLVEGYDMAVQYFLRAYALDPKNPKKFRNVITTLIFLDRRAEAEKYLDAAIARTDFGEEFVSTAKQLKRTLQTAGQF